MKDAPLASLIVASCESGTCCPVGVGTRQIRDFRGVRAVLRLHADDEIEQFFALDHLGGGLASNGGLHHGLNIGNIDSVAGDFVAVRIHDEARLSEFADNRQVREAGCLSEDIFDLDSFLLEDVQIRTKDFYG